MTKLYNMYFSTKCNVKEYLKNRKGQGMVEYVLIIALIGVVLTVALSGLATGIGAKFSEVVTKMNPGTPTTP